jgi:phage baseplate assembly protein W
MAVKKSQSFKDISLSFDRHPVTNDVTVLTNERAIIRSVRNIVETIPNEKYFNLNFGSDVRSSLFDFVDYSTALLIKDQIISSVRNYEPRIGDLDVNVIPNPDNNTFEATVSFDIVGQEIPPQEFSFLLEATR